MSPEDSQVTLNNFTKKERINIEERVIGSAPKLRQGWKCVGLNSIAKIVMGQSPPSETYNNDGVGLPFYQGKADFGIIHPTPRKWCSKPSKIALENDILISVRAPVGPVNICREKSCIGRGLATLRVGNDVDYKFLFFYLRSREAELMELGKGSTFGAIKKEDLERFAVPVPPLDVQRRVVARIEEIMSRVEQAKKLREEALRDTEAIMQSALHQTFKNPEQKGWNCKQLEEIADINTESRNPSAVAPDEEFTYIDISSIESGTGRIAQTKRMMGRDAPSRARRVVHAHDVLMSTVRPYLKSFGIVPEEYDNQICSTGFAVLTPKKSLRPEYLLYCLFSDLVINQCNSMMIGAHYPALNQKQVSQIKIPVPPIEEQDRIITYFDGISKKIQALKRYQAQTKKEIEVMTQAVLRKAFSGQI